MCDSSNPGGSGRPGDPELLQLKQWREDVFCTRSISQHRAEGGKSGGRSQKANIKRACKPLAEMGWQIEEGIDHDTAWKNAASGTPSTGTTSARSR